jgi:hypothetical protein
MSTFQLSIVIAFPILINFLFTAALFMIVNSRISDVNARIADLRGDMSTRFASLEKLIDQRFESLERELHEGRA